MAQHAEHTAEHAEHAHHAAPPWLYLSVYAALMLLLFATVAASYVDLNRYIPIPGLNIFVMLFIAVAKATLVVLFFMHVWDGTRLTWLWAGSGFVWFLILFLVFMDYFTRNWGPQSLGGATGWE